jgi:hypothetical protein
MAGVIDPVSVPDAGAFLARVCRLDPAALVRLRPRAPGRVGLWARLPFEVLVTREVMSPVDSDVTVRAADLLEGLTGDGATLPARRDSSWLWPVPPGPGQIIEHLPGAEVVRISAAAAGTMREATAARRVGERVLRDALLDHVPIVVEAAGRRYEISQRLVQAAVRMDFVGADSLVAVRVSGAWTGLAGEWGSAWHARRGAHPGLVALGTGTVRY